MRGLGRGQSVRVLIVRELRSLISEASRSGDLKVDIVHWLLLNSIKSEHLQQTQLCYQDVAYVWRRLIFFLLLFFLLFLLILIGISI